MVNCLLRVARIEGVALPDGRFGKRIIMVEDIKFGKLPVCPKGEMGEVIAQTLQQLQQVIPQAKFLGASAKAGINKITMILTEEEYDELELSLMVNETYSVSFRKGQIQLKRG